MTDSFEACEAMVKAADPDRYIAALFAPNARRRFLFALYAFNLEIARVAESVSQPMLGEIRLQWWRETVEEARAGKPRNHDVARALSATLAEVDLPFDLFDAMLEARIFDSSTDTVDTLEALETYADASSGNLMRLAALALHGDTHDALAREAGIAYALTGLIRARPFHAARDKTYLPESLVSDATASLRIRLAAARRLPKPGRALPAFLPAATCALYMVAPDSHVPLYRRQLAMLRASLRGTI
jgi:15-cis-phytoene synthase